MTNEALQVFERLESNVRSYCRAFPTVFARAAGSRLWDREGREYLDFFCGAGALSYGHNEPRLRERLLDYLAGDGVVHALDMATVAKETLLLRFEEIVLRPRGLSYRLQFPGPTGTNAVEAALKLARKVTGRTDVLYFTRAFHGMTLGALAVTANPAKRRGAGVPLPHARPMPYDGDLGSEADTIDELAAHLEGCGRGPELPAAAIVETVQAEGGVRVAGFGWISRLAELLRRHGVLLIVDDIQVGCGRTGTFFSFEPAGIEPDLICLSKAISGFGLPLSLVLVRPELDAWQPGEHNGTFRGNNLAFVTAAAALELFWSGEGLAPMVADRALALRAGLERLAGEHAAAGGLVRGRGLIQGLELPAEGLAIEVSRRAFARGVVVETAGVRDEVLKFLPPLTIEADELERGLELVGESLGDACAARSSFHPLQFTPPQQGDHDFLRKGAS